MALKQTWKDKVDGVDDVLAEDINSIARAVIENEENISIGKARDEEISGKIGDVSKEVQSIYETLGDYSKRITNIEERINPSFFYIDDGVAYKKNIPAKACPYALLTKLGGMTYQHQDSKVTALKVHSKNLVDAPEIINQTDVGVKAGTVSCYLTETCVVSAKANGVTLKNDRAVWRLEYISLSGKKNYITDTNMNDTGLIYGTEADPIVTINYRNTNMLTGSYSDIQIERGTVATEYSPFGVLATIELPEELQNIDGYGVGKDENTYNYIDFESKKFVKNVEIVGNEVVALETPKETDITTDFDNFIEVEGGGSIEFVNEYEQAVPSEISYMLKES